MSIEASVVTELKIWPVKSLGGIAVDSVRTCPTGLEHDREFMLTVLKDGQSTMLSQSELPSLSRFTTEIADRTLRVTAPDFADEIQIDLDREPDGDEIELGFYDRVGTAAEHSREASEFFTDILALGAPVWLMKSIKPRPVKESTQSSHEGAINRTAFADSNPIHLISQASLDKLNEHIAANGGIPVTSDFFRPNIVVNGLEMDGVVQPYAEDHAGSLKVGAMFTGSIQRSASRCDMVTIDPATGLKSRKDVMRVLSATRLGKEDPKRRGYKTFFGSYVIPNYVAKEIHIDDQVTARLCKKRLFELAAHLVPQDGHA